MSKCNFSIDFPGHASDMITRVKGEIEKQGGSFNGDDTTGNFSVKIFGSSLDGSYTVAGSQININIDSKPIFVSCSQIESFLKDHISG